MRARTIPLRGRIKRKALLRMRALVGYQNKEYILLLLLLRCNFCFEHSRLCILAEPPALYISHDSYYTPFLIFGITELCFHAVRRYTTGIKCIDNTSGNIHDRLRF